MENFAVVILNYNTFEDTVVCVDSIKKYTACSSYKVYVVDNASPDKSGQLLASEYAQDYRVQVLISETNLGFSGGNNIGIRKALEEGFKYVYLLNSDIILQNDAFAYMQEAFASNKDVAIVGPSIYNPKGKYVQFARHGITAESYLTSKKLFKTFFPGQKNKSRFIDYPTDKDFIFNGMVSGCCFGMSSAFIRQNNCLDENLFMYYEEDILAYVLQNAKKSAMIANESRVIHNEGISTQKKGDGKMLFTRFYRWTSVIYVLLNYAKLNRFVCALLSLQNIGCWLVMSLYNKKYRESLRAFVAENKRVLNAKPLQ
ncbi:MAG: glycosyltransferase family 2 protein [Fibrobacter sp.]|uniref:glycosyltransferase n=1 Tax=Fibrobacter sp. TaxID=35828 RepID=UPI0025BC1A65|nr:glycosyltransferase family 2 protein [Fibrobacter sp.]MBQ3722043.1 glycosyltransferase family 2 protein [Fibrobacter sp.]MBQ7079658.1 glycosyltransferase family 2 protein [Fibrobacter sp.]